MSVGVFNAETNETKDVANKSRTAIIDSEMSEESQNPLQNRVITQKITELNQSIEELNTLLNGMDETLGGKLDVSKIANNLVTTEEGYALDARMGKELGKRLNFSTYVSKYLDFKGLANNESVTVSISIPTNGIYLLIFDIAHCGASNGIATGGYWSVDGVPMWDFGLQCRQLLNIPISCSWDSVNGNSFRLLRLSASQYDFTFTNCTGITTDANYHSRIVVTAIPLKED